MIPRTLRLRLVAAVIAVGGVAALGCGGESPTSPPPPPPPPPPPSAVKLAFTVQPSNAEGMEAIAPSVQVTIETAAGARVAGATTAVTLAIETDSTGGTLFGALTKNAVNGIATFDSLAIDRPGAGYTLSATAAGLTAATSAAFSIHLTFTAVSTAFYHACGVTAAHAAYCWGANYEAEFGTGTPSHSPTPVAVSGGLAFSAMSTGGFYGCGVTTSDTAYCWGQNNDGDLGTGLTSNSTTPLPVAGGLSFAAISASLGTYSYAGGSHSRTCALTNAGTAYCWGDNFDGELGTSDTVHRTTPAAVSGGLTFGTVTAGGFHSCGLTTAGAAYCWGDNTYGQLGRGDTISSTIPVAVSGGLTFAALRAGGLFTCGVAVAGAAYCWGDNRDGELGTGDTIRSVSPVAVSGGLTFSSVSPGRNHACALTITGAAYCWGSNDNAKLGNGEYGLAGYSLVPRAVAGGLTFVAVSAGGYLSCAVTSTGAAYCWGDNIDGELGNGGGSSSAVPVRVVH